MSVPPQRLYANCLRVGYNAFEFVLDFGQLFGEAEAERLHSGIVTSPIYAKNFFETLGGSIAQYEATFGPIPKADREG